MIELVLGDARSRLHELEPLRLAGDVRALDRDLERALHGHEHTLDGEATLLVRRRLLRTLREDRVHEHVVLALVDEDEEPAQYADLRRGEAYSLSLVHQRRHPLDEARELLVEALHLTSLHA